MKASVLFLLLILNWGSQAQQPASEERVTRFSDFLFSVSNLDGMFSGVLDYCQEYIPESIANRSKGDWMRANEKYIRATEHAIDQILALNVAIDEQDNVRAALRSNMEGWYQEAFSNSTVLGNVRKADNSQVECARTLASMVSRSFALEKIAPGAHAYWEEYLRGEDNE